MKRYECGWDISIRILVSIWDYLWCKTLNRRQEEQECIPVGCVLADRRPYAGVCFPGGSPCPGGSASGGDVSGPGGFSMPGGCSPSPGGVLLARPPLWTEWQTGVKILPWPKPGGGSPCQTPPVNRMTNRCKNITLAKTSFRPVKICLRSRGVVLKKTLTV